MFQANLLPIILNAIIPNGSGEEVYFVVFAIFSNMALLDIRLDPILPMFH